MRGKKTAREVRKGKKERKWGIPVVNVVCITRELKRGPNGREQEMGFDGGTAWGSSEPPRPGPHHLGGLVSSVLSKHRRFGGNSPGRSSFLCILGLTNHHFCPDRTLFICSFDMIDVNKKLDSMYKNVDSQLQWFCTRFGYDSFWTSWAKIAHSRGKPKQVWLSPPI